MHKVLLDRTPFQCGRLIPQRHVGQKRMLVRAESKEKPEPGLGLKTVWVGAENFGKLIGFRKGDKSAKTERKQQQKMNRQEVIDSIRADYDVNYFVSGKGDMEAYDPDCLFADPFAGFNGVDRFKQNVSNLGGLLSDIRLDIYKFDERESEVETKWRFSALIDLPWRPRLAAAGGTTHVLDEETNKVVKHIEAWDVEPSKVLKTLLEPSNKNPNTITLTERFMLALSKGDPKGMWIASSVWALNLAGPMFVISQIASLYLDDTYSGFIGFIHYGSWFLLAEAALAQIFRILEEKKPVTK